MGMFSPERIVGTMQLDFLSHNESQSLTASRWPHGKSITLSGSHSSMRPNCSSTSPGEPGN